jgi:hypothetical protein
MEEGNYKMDIQNIATAQHKIERETHKEKAKRQNNKEKKNRRKKTKIALLNNN